MQFFPKEICEKFVKMGCVSESLIYHGLTPAFQEGALLFNPSYFDSLGYAKDRHDILPAFTPWDFIGTSEQSRKNAEILWPGADYVPITYPVAMLAHLAFNTKSVHNYESHRHAAINAPDAMEYIMRFVK